VGSTGRTTFELRDSGPVLVKTLDYLFVDDKAGKPVGIWQFIGRRPIACFGNTDGNQAMLHTQPFTTPAPASASLSITPTASANSPMTPTRRAASSFRR